VKAAINRASLRRALPWCVEAGLYASVAVVALLYSKLFADNVLAKGGVLLILVGLLVLLSAARSIIDARISLPRLRVYIPFACFVVWSLISAFAANNPTLGAETVLLHAAPFGLFLVVIHHCRTHQAIARLLWTVVLTSIAVSAIGVAQYLGFDPLDGVGWKQIPVSTMGNPNFAAYYQDLVLPVMVAILLSRWREAGQLSRVLLILAVALGATHLIVAGSRAGWFSAVVAVGLLVVVTTPRGSWSRRLPGILLVLLLLLPIGQVLLQSISVGRQETLYGLAERVGQETWDRALTAFDVDDFSRYMRVLIWRDTMSMIADAPVLGVGPGAYRQALPPYIERDAWGSLMKERTATPYEPRHAHNEYLEFAAEIGVVGLLIIAWVFAALLGLGLAYLRPVSANDGRWLAQPSRVITLGVLCGIIASLIHALTGFNLHHPVVISQLWLLAGLMVAMHLVADDAESSSGGISLHSTTRVVNCGVIGLVIALVLTTTGCRILLSDYYYEHGMLASNVPRAIRSFESATTWREYDFRAHRMLGRLSMMQDRVGAARASLERSVDLQANDAGALRMLGGLLIRAGDPTATKLLLQAISSDRSNTQSFVLLAQAYRQAGQIDSAVSAMESALERQPEQADLMVLLALVHRDGGQMAQCVAILEEAARLAPDDGQVIGNLGAVHVEMGNASAAEDLLRRAVQLDPGNQVNWLSSLTEALELQDRIEEAHDVVNQALQRAPDDLRLQEILRGIEERRQAGTK
jgi:putative inorganic carbon (hco3(-)) transporter